MEVIQSPDGQTRMTSAGFVEVKAKEWRNGDVAWDRKRPMTPTEWGLFNTAYALVDALAQLSRMD